VARPIIAMIASFFVISLLGSAFIFAYWLHRDSTVGVVRSVGFVAIMGGVHCVGYRLWKRQQAAIPEQAEGHACASIWEAYAEPIKVAVAQQAVILLFASLLLDGGQMLRLSTIATAAAWALNIVIMARRPKSPTQADVLIVKYGFWLFALVTLILAPIMGRTL
jgi:lipid-A-disaccharide synthase-like uncharacterized protein